MWTSKRMVVLLVVVLLLVTAVPTFAQSVSTTTLQIDQNLILPNLFQGANIILVALGAVVFLMAGFTFGVMVLRGILRVVGNIKF